MIHANNNNNNMVYIALINSLSTSPKAQCDHGSRYVKIVLGARHKQECVTSQLKRLDYFIFTTKETHNRMVPSFFIPLGKPPTKQTKEEPTSETLTGP